MLNLHNAGGLRRLWFMGLFREIACDCSDCADPRASLGSSAALAWNSTTDRYEVFYVGFKSCNDSSFVNRQGRIYRAS